MVCALLYMLNKKHAHVTFRRCVCLSAYPFVAQLAAKSFSESEPELMGALACFATLFCVGVFPKDLRLRCSRLPRNYQEATKGIEHILSCHANVKSIRSYTLAEACTHACTNADARAKGNPHVHADPHSRAFAHIHACTDASLDHLLLMVKEC